MNFDFIKNMTHEKKTFYTFLLVHLIVWTVIGLVRTVLPTDSLEGIYWGMFHDFGTPKHPPLAAWITYLAYIPLKLDVSIYFISQFFIVLGFIYTYKLARYFLDENKSILSVILLEGCWCYSYITGYYGFNPDVILMFTLPAIAYYFYNCMYFENKKDWLILGLLVGFSLLNKYQTMFLVVPMAIWAFLFKKETFKNKYFYGAIAIAFAIFLPHIIWLFQHDFYSLLYFEGELTAPTWINHITAPLTFLLMQIGLIAGSLVIFGITKAYTKTPWQISKGESNKDRWFLLLLCLTPLVIHLLMGLWAGGTMRPRWGFVFWFMTGILLYYFVPVQIKKKEFDLTVKSAYATMLIIFLALGSLLVVEKNYRSRYPVSTVWNDLNKAWEEKQSTPLEYIGGYIEWTLPLTIYVDSHPKCILDNHGYKDPWIDSEDVKKSGILIMGRKIKDVEDYTFLSCPYLPKDYKIEPIEYKFFVKNALNMPREYTIYYHIVPPMK